MPAMLQAVSDTGRLPGRTRRPVRAYDPALGEAAMIIAHAPDTQATIADARQAVQESSSRISGRVSLVERIPGKRDHHVPDRPPAAPIAEGARRPAPASSHPPEPMMAAIACRRPSEVAWAVLLSAMW
jgi:hypothetical protein